MPTFFHVTRTDISQLETFDLTPISMLENPLSLEDVFSEDDFKKLLSGLYVNGISHRGRAYLCRQFGLAGGPGNVHYVEYAPMFEAAFELMLQLKFKERKSRFEITFGCKTLKDAEKIMMTTFNGDGKIYIVECENYKLADMNLAKTGLSIAGTFIMAEKYWAGESSNDPFWEVLMESPIRILGLAKDFVEPKYIDRISNTD